MQGIVVLWHNKGMKKNLNINAQDQQRSNQIGQELHQKGARVVSDLPAHQHIDAANPGLALSGLGLEHAKKQEREQEQGR